MHRPAIADKASYSSSEDEDDPGNNGHGNDGQGDGQGPLHKNPRISPTSPSKRKIHPPPQTHVNDVAMPAPHRKAYDWLEPSAAGASHHGPPERQMLKITGWVPGEDGKPVQEEGTGDNGGNGGVAVAVAVAGAGAGAGAGVAGEGKQSKSRKKAEQPPGRGKAWRKGLKK